MAFGRIPRFSPSFSPRELAVVARSLTRRGDEQAVIHRFEHEFACTIGVKHAVMVPSARYGFYLLLKGMGLEPGDEIILPAMTYWAIPSIALAAGYEIRIADIGLHTHVMDPDAFEAAITDRTRAVVPTHLFGTPCHMPRIREIADAHDIRVIEDTAQATGARVAGRRAGSLGHAAYFTFGLTKNMTTLSGAMVTTDDEALASWVRREMDATAPAALGRSLKETFMGTAMMVATHPWVYPFTLHPFIALGNQLGKDPIHEPFGEPEVRYDSVPTHYRQARPRALQAHVGLTQLSRLDDLNRARIENGRYLDENLANVPGLDVPAYPEGSEPIYMSFVVHHPRRTELATALRRRGVDTTIGYMSNLADHPLFDELRTDCPQASTAFRELLHIPVHPNLGPSERAHIVESVRSACNEVRP